MKNKIAYGTRYTDQLGVIVVLACVDGYVMARRPGAIPFVLPVKLFLKRYPLEVPS